WPIPYRALQARASTGLNVGACSWLHQVRDRFVQPHQSAAADSLFRFDERVSRRKHHEQHRHP
ncbi:hypothetical protein, partial [Frigoribacterium sp. Leaf186]|uniref:hypothetical protein n=1 Tax=Frigoribacterium sp. Leaf186 TaxID=1736293 RepID=UPI001F28FEFA